MRLFKSRLEVLGIGILIVLVAVFGYSFFEIQLPGEYCSSCVYATDSGIIVGTDTGDTGTDQDNQEYIQTLETTLKFLYMVMRPSLAIAGAALDNSMVYGTIFGLDVTLWKFRQMMRTFSNYILGFLFVGSIMMAFFKQQTDQSRIKKLFKRLLIAGILINMSRWMVAALVDLSTIATVAVGGLPLHVMKDSAERKDITYLKSHGLMDQMPSVNEQQDLMSHSVIYSCAGTPDWYFLPCYIQNGAFVPYGLETTEGTWDNYAKKFESAWGSIPENSMGPVTMETIDHNYCVYGNDLYINNAGGDANSCSLMEVAREGGASYKKGMGCATMDDLMTKAAGSTGPLYTLYGSIFHMSRLALTTNFGSTGEIALEMLMKAFVGIALIVPLLALAMALVIRVVFLWLVIAFSPILVLAYVFEFKQIESAAGQDKLKMSTVISLIFLPVFAVFALSISVVFLSILGNIEMTEKAFGKAETANEQADGCFNDPLTALGAMRTEGVADGEAPEQMKCYEYAGVEVVCLTEKQRQIGSDVVNTMVWLVINFFGIALMWTVVFFVLKSNKVTEGAVSSLQSVATTLLKSAPIIPIGGGTSVAALEQLPTKVNDGLTRYSSKQYTDSQLKKYIDNKSADISGSAKQVESGLADGSIKITNASAEAVSNTDFRDYDGGVTKIASVANGTAHPQGGRSYQVNGNQSMTGLMNDKEFIRYMQDNGESGYSSHLQKWDKSGLLKNKVTFSKEYAEGLRKAAGAGNVMGSGVLTDSLIDPQNGVQPEFIWYNDRLTYLPWIQEDGERVLDYGRIKEYKVGTDSIRADEADAFGELIADFNGFANMPARLRDKYQVNVADKVTRSVGENAAASSYDVSFPTQSGGEALVRVEIDAQGNILRMGSQTPDPAPTTPTNPPAS